MRPDIIGINCAIPSIGVRPAFVGINSAVSAKPSRASGPRGGDVHAQRKQTIQKIEKDLVDVQKMIRAGNFQQFFDTFAELLRQYLANILHISPIGFTTESLAQRFEHLGQKAKYSTLIEILRQYKRFAPTSKTVDEMQDVLNAAKKAIRQIEQ